MSAAVEQFRHDAERLTHDLRHRSLIQTALKKYELARDARKSRYKDWQSARQTASEIKSTCLFICGPILKTPST